MLIGLTIYKIFIVIFQILSLETKLSGDLEKLLLAIKYARLNKGFFLRF